LNFKLEPTSGLNNWNARIDSGVLNTMSPLPEEGVTIPSHNKDGGYIADKQSKEHYTSVAHT